MPKWFIFLLILNSSISYGQHCDDPNSMRKRITQLKIEVSCSSMSSLHDCAPLLKSLRHDQNSREIPQGERCELDLNPLTRPAGGLASAIVENRLIMGRAPENWFVNSVEDFYEHTRLHKQRVKILGQELFRTHPELFQGLTQTQVDIALEAHDRAKLSSTALAKSGKTFYQELYENYRKKPSAELIEGLNKKDAEFMDEAYKLVGLGDNKNMTATERARRKLLREKLRRIEKIADLVDRGNSPVAHEEFGRTLSSAHSFLKSEEDKRLAIELERKYARLTKNLEYQVMNPSQRARLGRQIMREEKFSQVIATNGLKSISAKAMGYQILRKSKSGFVRAAGMLSTQTAKRIFLAADFIGLYFADMDRLGCDGLGYHDWVKDPNCEPAIALTPKFISFLNEDFASQMQYLKTQPGTCHVLNATYVESMEKPQVKSCSSKMLELKINEKLIQVELDSHKKMKGIKFGKLGSEVNDSFRGNPERVEINSKGVVSKACYKTTGRESFVTCLDQNSGSKELNKMNDFVKSLNYTIQKSLLHCSLE